MPKNIKYYREKIKRLEKEVRELKKQLNAKAKIWKKSEAESAALIGELKHRTEELEKFEKFTVGRELKMVELKNRIKELEGKGK